MRALELPTYHRAVERRPWNEREIRSALALYYQIPFGAIDHRNPAIIELADVLERSPGSVGLKLANLASLDPTVVASGRRGMRNSSKLDRKVFFETLNDWNTLAFELPLSVLDAIDRKRVRSEAPEMIRDAPLTEETTMQVTEALGTVLLRRGQTFFRNATLAAYRGCCCVTALPVRELLRASHIVPWAIDDKTRLDPANGLCLNALYDAAFDRGLMTIDEDYRVVFAKELSERMTNELWHEWFAPHDGRVIDLPERLTPRPSALEFHREHVFVGE